MSTDINPSNPAQNSDALPAAAAPVNPVAPAPNTIKPNPPVVEFRNVGKVYDGAKPFTAIKNVNFTIEDRPDHGEFVCILGPSGCGKSTVLRMIAGLAPQYPQSSGDVLLFGRQVAPAAADRGMVFQDYTSFDHLHVWENIAFGLECRGVPLAERKALALDWVQKVGLSREKDAYKYPHQLSGGMRQRVAIARSLILKPRIMLMDEPFGALDPATRLAMQDLLISLWKEQQSSVFFITHAIDEACFLSDRILIMSPAPGTILREIRIERTGKTASEMQRDPAFQNLVFEVREFMEKLEQPK
jgi:NitT/TauT family transport system ATP-binding protein